MTTDNREAIKALTAHERNAIDGRISNCLHEAERYFDVHDTLSEGDMEVDEESFWAYHEYHALTKLLALTTEPPAEGGDLIERLRVEVHNLDHPKAVRGLMLEAIAALTAAGAAQGGGEAVPLVQQTAPERIFLCVADDDFCRDEAFPRPWGEDLTWSTDQPVRVCVPYVRADLTPTPAAQPSDGVRALPRYRLASTLEGVRNLHRDDTGAWVRLADVEAALSSTPAAVGGDAP